MVKHASAIADGAIMATKVSTVSAISKATKAAKVDASNTTTRSEKSLSDIARQPVWKVSEAALVLRCNERTVRRELKRGAIRGVRIGNEWRIPADQFSALARAARSPQSAEVSTVSAGVLVDKDHTRPSSVPFESMARTPTKGQTQAQTQPQPQPQHVLSIHLFGHPRIYIDDVRVAELERSNRCSQLIHLLALYRAGLSGARLASSLNIASHQYEDESLNPCYVRNLVWRTREQAERRVGWGGVIQSLATRGAGLHHYRLPDNAVCDLWEFEARLDEADKLLARAACAPDAPDAPKSSQILGPIALGKGIGVVTKEATKHTRNTRGGFLDQAAALREEALQLYKGEFCEGSNNGCIVQAARVLEERYLRAALQQGDYWRGRALGALAPASRGTQVSCSFASVRGATASGVSGTPTSAHPSHPEVQTIWREALRNYERVLNIDNYHEEAYTHAMECYAYLGNARGVDQIFMRYQDVLHADLLQAPGEGIVRTYGECKKLLGLTGMVAHRP